MRWRTVLLKGKPGQQQVIAVLDESRKKVTNVMRAASTLAFSSTKCSFPLTPKQTPAETVTCLANFARWINRNRNRKNNL